MKYIKKYELWNPFKQKEVSYEDLIKPDSEWQLSHPQLVSLNVNFGFPYYKNKMIFWKIYPEGFELALKRIGMNPYAIKRLVSDYSLIFADCDYVFICKQIPSLTSNVKVEINWFYVFGIWGVEEDLKRRKGRYMGEVKIEPYEIDAEKYNL